MTTDKCGATSRLSVRENPLKQIFSTQTGKKKLGYPYTRIG
jgi:hypothetical protein